MTYNNKKVIVSVIYHSPSQNYSEFDLFFSNFEKLLNDISERKWFLSVIASDFNALTQNLHDGGLKTSIQQKGRNCFH